MVFQDAVRQDSRAVFLSVPSTFKPEESEVTLWPPPKVQPTANPKDEPEPKPKPKPEPSSRASNTEKSFEAVLTEESTIVGPMTTKTDSGRTVTIPNDEVITVTRHTTIVTDKSPRSTSNPPEPTAGAPESSTRQVGSPPPASTETPGQAPDSDSGLPTGGIIGIGIGGAALIAFLVILAVMIKRSRKRRQEQEQTEAESEDQVYGGADRYDEKHFPQHMSAHSTGTQGSKDPFAPFGGRVNADSEYPNRPASNTFEMDATAAAPVELPDSGPTEPEPRPVASSMPAALQVANGDPIDPRANLNSLGNEDGRPKYVNHWNQYRSMGPS